MAYSDTSPSRAHDTSFITAVRPGLERESIRWPLEAVGGNSVSAQQILAQVRANAQEDSKFTNKHLAATYHHPQTRPRRRLDESGLSVDQFGRSVEDDSLTYERMTRSYRDTTSEIISLYTSRNVLSRNASTPRGDDDGLLVNGHSRYPVTSRHTQSKLAALNSTNSQKSRTPGPYPTRLRRPGNNVASPTMIEVRNIEYGKIARHDRLPTV